MLAQNVDDGVVAIADTYIFKTSVKVTTKSQHICLLLFYFSYYSFILVATHRLYIVSEKLIF